MLTLHSGEWFENMKSQEFSAGVSVPYRRETFVKKRIVLDFDADFNVADASALSNNARGKSIGQINRDVDSLNHVYDSVGRVFYKDAKMSYYSPVAVSKKDSLRAVKMAGTKTYSFDSVYSRLSADRKLEAVDAALSKVQREMNDLDFKGMITADGDKLIRQHKIEAINKFTLSLSCLIFFFIGAPLGAIIRKGGLGVPVIISVLVFIVYYISRIQATACHEAVCGQSGSVRASLRQCLRRSQYSSHTRPTTTLSCSISISTATSS